MRAGEAGDLPVIQRNSHGFYHGLFHQIPRSYLTLQEVVIAEKQRRHAKGEVQYLTDAQLDCIVEQNPESDIRDYEDLQTGNVTFSKHQMHETT